jgi:bacterioferritin-associated ferredoxin
LDIPGLLNLPRSDMVRYSVILNSMIVCSCNVLSDHEVRDVVTASGSHSLSAHEVYGCLGCSMQCGRCTRAVKRILNETLANRVGGGAGCPATHRSEGSAAGNVQANANDRNFRQAEKQELLTLYHAAGK